MKDLKNTDLLLAATPSTDLGWSGDTTTVTVDTNAVGFGAAQEHFLFFYNYE